MQVADIIKLVEELTSTKQELAKLKKQLDVINEAKRKRAEAAKRKSRVTPEEKVCGEVLRLSLMRLKKQHYQDVVTTKEIIKTMMIKLDCSKYNFFSHFNKSVERLLSYKIFVDECGSLDSKAVAQHVVLRGESAVKKVFKYGLKSTFDDAMLGLMDKAIFSEAELEATQYIKEHQASVKEIAPEEAIS